MANRIEKFHSEDLKIRAAAAVTTDLVRNASAIHDSFPVATMAIGRVLTGAALLASMQKEKQKVGIRVRGDGPLGEIFADATFEGATRAYCQRPQTHLPLRDGQLDVAGAVGAGTLTVMHSMPFQRQPHQGIVPLVSGEISQDLAYYLQQSYQIPSVIALAVSLDREGNVTAAGGVLVEVLPGASEQVLRALEEKAMSGTPLSRLLLEENDLARIVTNYAHGSPLVRIEHKAELRYACPCSMERVERTLVLLGTATLSEMILKGEPVQVKCEFCGKRYAVPTPRVRGLLSEMKSPKPRRGVS